LTDCLDGGSALYKSFLPQASAPSDWPACDPMGQALLMVENHPLEIRLWSTLSPGRGHA
jgi:hypothetical protein